MQQDSSAKPGLKPGAVTAAAGSATVNVVVAADDNGGDGRYTLYQGSLVT